jgi:hypothetical protein
MLQIFHNKVIVLKFNIKNKSLIPPLFTYLIFNVLQMLKNKISDKEIGKFNIPHFLPSKKVQSLRGGSDSCDIRFCEMKNYCDICVLNPYCIINTKESGDGSVEKSADRHTEFRETA